MCEMEPLSKPRLKEYVLWRITNKLKIMDLNRWIAGSNDEAQAIALARKYRNTVPQLIDASDRRNLTAEITKHDLVIRYRGILFSPTDEHLYHVQEVSF